jgi:hypothetical protein
MVTPSSRRRERSPLDFADVSRREQYPGAMRKAVLVALLVVIAGRDAAAMCFTAPWFGTPSSRTLPHRGSLYVQEATAESLAETFTWIGGTGSISFVELGEQVVRVDYDAGTAHALEARFFGKVLSIGNPPQATQPPAVIRVEHSGYNGDFICAHSSMADITIDRAVAAFHAVWTAPCSTGRCVFADQILASRTDDEHGLIQFGNLGCGTVVFPARPTFDGPPLPENLELTLTAIEFDGRETSVQGAPSWAAIEAVLSTPLPRDPIASSGAASDTPSWLLAELAGLLATLVALAAMTARAARKLDC